mmetsp:Transcript_67411/g.160842  ORF Transcript_67411/g.160842 Transcript_67411/m.160842 type:complete len:275 (-) Transcript_67411:2689-3513(-)
MAVPSVNTARVVAADHDARTIAGPEASVRLRPAAYIASVTLGATSSSGPIDPETDSRNEERRSASCEGTSNVAETLSDDESCPEKPGRMSVIFSPARISIAGVTSSVMSDTLPATGVPSVSADAPKDPTGVENADAVGFTGPRMASLSIVGDTYASDETRTGDVMSCTPIPRGAESTSIHAAPSRLAWTVTAEPASDALACACSTETHRTDTSPPGPKSMPTKASRAIAPVRFPLESQTVSESASKALDAGGWSEAQRKSPPGSGEAPALGVQP